MNKSQLAKKMDKRFSGVDTTKKEYTKKTRVIHPKDVDGHKYKHGLDVTSNSLGNRKASNRQRLATVVQSTADARWDAYIKERSKRYKRDGITE